MASLNRESISISTEVAKKLSAGRKCYIIRRKQIEPDCVEGKKITEKKHSCTHPDFPKPRNVA